MKIIQVFVLVVFLAQTLVSGASLSGASSDPVLGQDELDDQTVINVDSVRTMEEQTEPPTIQSAHPNSTYLQPQTIQSAPHNSSTSTYLDPEFLMPIEQEPDWQEHNYFFDEPWKIFGIVVGSFILVPLVLIPICFGVGLLIFFCFIKKDRPNVRQNAINPSGPMLGTQNSTNPTSPILEAHN